MSLDGLELVVLAACESGDGLAFFGQGTLGMHRAFLETGVQSVLASIWTVPDNHSPALMADFYRRLWSRKEDPISALNGAQRALRKELQSRDTTAGERLWG